jgi:hypothetical protein
VARLVEDQDRQVARRLAQRGGDALHDALGVLAQIDRVAGCSAHDELVHVVPRARRPQLALAGHADRRQRAGQLVRAEVGALDRIDGDVKARARVGADLLAVEEHRRVVLLTFADDDDPAARDVAEHVAHRLRGGAVGCLAVAAAGPVPRGDRRHANGGQRQRLEATDHVRRNLLGGAGRLLGDAHRSILTCCGFVCERNVCRFSLDAVYEWSGARSHEDDMLESNDPATSGP